MGGFFLVSFKCMNMLYLTCSVIVIGGMHSELFVESD